MSEDTNTPPFSLPEKLTTPYKRLAKNLSFTGRFQWIFAVFGDSHLRQRIFEQLNDTVAQKIVSLSEIQDIFEFENLIKSAAKNTTCLHLVDTRHLFDNEDSNWPNLLNLHREAIAQKAPVNLVFWMDDEHLTYLAKNAPDFWNWRSAVYEFLVPVAAEIIGKPAILFQELEWLTPLSDTEQLRLEQLQKRFAEKPANSPAEADLQLEMARLQLRQNHIESAEQAIYMAEKLYQQDDDKNGIANCYVFNGQISIWLEERRAALSYFKKAMVLFQETQNPGGQAICHYHMGNVYKVREAHDKASEHLAAALTLFEQLKDNLWQGKTLVAIAEIALKQHRLDDSKKHYLDTLALLESVAGAESQPSVLQGLAKIEEQQGNFQTARKYFLQALDVSKKRKDFLRLDLVLGELSAFELEQGNVDAIEVIFKETLNYFDLKVQPLGQAHVFLAWGLAMLKQRQFQRALDYTEQAGQLFHEHNYLLGYASSLMLQMHYHHMLNDISAEHMDKLVKQALQAAKDTQVPSVLHSIENTIKAVHKT